MEILGELFGRKTKAGSVVLGVVAVLKFRCFRVSAEWREIEPVCTMDLSATASKFLCHEGFDVF
jgi:hypothetical protein